MFGGAVAGATAPVVTYALMAVNILAYVVEVARSETVDRFGMLGAVLVDP
ncbi:rhomboid family intramembrane serine protease, partial [Streptomyces sp. gb1(2016)]